MGVWGPGLYQDDTALDVKSTFAETARYPVDVDELVGRVVATFGMGDDPMSEVETDFWLALADQLHRFGLDHPPSFATARQIITSGADLKAKEALEMDPRDLKKRARVLSDLLDAWSRPHPKPRQRRVMKGPEPFVFEVGDVWTYPTMNHAPVPTHWWRYDPETIDDYFKPDGWGAFLVFDRWHHQDYLARYLIAVIYLEKGGRPDIDTVRGSVVDGWFDPDWTAPPDIVRFQDFHFEMAYSAAFPKAKTTLRQWTAEKLGTLPVDAKALRAKARAIVERDHGASQGVASLQHLVTLRSFHNESSLKPSARYEPCAHLPVADLLAG